MTCQLSAGSQEQVLSTQGWIKTRHFHTLSCATHDTVAFTTCGWFRQSSVKIHNKLCLVIPSVWIVACGCICLCFSDAGRMPAAQHRSKHKKYSRAFIYPIVSLELFTAYTETPAFLLGKLIFKTICNRSTIQPFMNHLHFQLLVFCQAPFLPTLNKFH